MAAVCVQATGQPALLQFRPRRRCFDHRSAAFMESSETPPKGERAAACIWNNEAFTKALDVVPRALFNRRHQSFASPSGGWTFASLPSACHTLTRTEGSGADPQPALLSCSACSSFAYPVIANNRTKVRSHFRSLMASAVQVPSRKFPFL